MSELFLVRHGESKANVSCTVVCTLEEGVQPRWGLTTRGEQQALAAGDELLRRIHSSHNASELIIVSSPFSRAKQTASAIQRRTGAAIPITEDSRVVERFFGSQFELKNASDVYYRMLEGDTKSLLDSPIEGAEAVVDVASRVSAAMADATNSANGRSVVIVSHGCFPHVCHDDSVCLEVSREPK
jgi:broad specificity phosphatase PhoE